MFNAKIVPSGRRLGRGASPPANPYSFVRRHHVYRLKGRRPQWDVVLHHPQTLIPSSGSTTSVGLDGSPATETWCFTARKPLFLRPEAPRLSGRMGLRRLGRGASLPANPYSFVRKHHVCRSGWAFGGWDVVLHRPQTLIPSYGSTTSFGPDGPPASMGCGASPPAYPCFFVRRHHGYRSGGAFDGGGVMLHCPQILVPSSGGTTSVGPDGPSAAGTWCCTARKPLFLRPEAPRLSVWMG